VRKKGGDTQPRKAQQFIASRHFLQSEIGDSVNNFPREVPMNRKAINGLDRVQFSRLLDNQAELIVAARPRNDSTATPETPDIRCFDNSLVFPGAFNPLHDGHLAMADLASRRFQRPLWFEISVENVDKPPLDFRQVAIRTQQVDHPYGLVLTRTPTFDRKSTLFPGCIFVVGADTIERINEPRYYQDDPGSMHESIRKIADNGCRFLVFPRKPSKIGSADPKIQSRGPLLERLHALCEFVSAEEFCMEISSSELRNRQQE
jgi:nicotinic acid mononucleotide adenylyltransferase